MTDQSDIKPEIRELSKSINELIIEMRERDVKDGYLREKIALMQDTQNKTIDTWTPVWLRAKKDQDNRDSFFASARSTSGKIFMVAIIVSLLLAAGINPKSLGL